MSHPKINHHGPIQLATGHSANAALQAGVASSLATLQARKQSPKTIQKRRDCLRKFLLYLDANAIERFAEVDLKTLEGFRACLVEHDYSPNEIEASLRSVQFLFRHLADTSEIFENPATHLKIRKPPLTLGTVLTARQVQRLLAQPDIATPKGLRDRAILELLYSTGLRRGEAAGLNLHDVDLDRATVKVSGKFGKQRMIPLGKHAVKYLRLYLQASRPRFVPQDRPAPDAFWLDRLHQRLSASSICRIVNICAAQVGIHSDTHTLRRTCATHLLRGGAHPAVVAQILGHSGLKSLSHYLRTTITDLQHAHANSNPGT